jgi:GTP-binding protein HflX
MLRGECMEKMELLEKEHEKALLVGLNLTTNLKRSDDIDINDSMKELEELAKAAGAEVVGSLIQNKQSIDAAFYMGKGKIEEIAAYSKSLDATVIIFNDELSGSQIRNIEDTVGVKIIDRTTLILDIFAQRAMSKEGKLQVELAQLRYRLPRLYGMGGQMSRTGAGIGTRGPGEQKLEVDKRHILNRQSDIRKELKLVRKNRETQRIQRKKSKTPIVALVGYTNAGKSTLLNELIKTHKDYHKDKEVFQKNMLFATLDVTLRKASLPNKKEFLVVDTVGFVSKLPHDLIEAFKATLEEVQYADLILHVIDATNESFEIQQKTTDKVLKELDIEDKKQILVYNKVDKLELDIYPKNHPDVVYISARQGINMDKLMNMIEEALMDDMYEVNLLLPYDKANIFSELKNKYTIDDFEYVDSGIEVNVSLNEKDFNTYQSYILEK